MSTEEYKHAFVLQKWIKEHCQLSQLSIYQDNSQLILKQYF
jgi:hypothetical protein